MPTATIKKPRYELLDGLRGVAALCVIIFHFGEGFATSPVDQLMNHGYLAVDFFFVLSGFVLGYAYDDRWNKGMNSWGFMVRRVIRLHPMVLLSVIFGACTYFIQGSVKWDGTVVSPHWVAVALILGMFVIPVIPGFDADVRGNGEMFPLNGPSWSLFFEYIGSIMYGFWLHRLNRKVLTTVVVVSAIGLAACALANFSGAYSIGFGWSAGGFGFLGGFMRLSFSFGIGLLMSRIINPKRIRGAFWICTILIVIVLSCPYITGAVGDEPSPFNAIYDIVCTWVVFPAIVYIGASGKTTDKVSGNICDFLGRLSYPVYIIHYPIMYLFYAWVWNNGITASQALPVCGGIFVTIIILAWVAMRFYDEPVRRWLSDKLLRHRPI